MWEYAKETGELRVGVNKSALTTKANNIADINILSRFEVYAKAAYSPERAVKYAARYNEKSTKKDGHKADRNGAYKSCPNGDCTNYVSQCVNYAGKNMQPKKLPVKQECTDNLKYWFNKKYTYKINGEKKKLFKYSTSFVRVGDFYKYWGQKRGYKIDGTYWDTDKNSKLQRVWKLGDIVQVHEFLGGWHHSIIITGGKQGDWKYSGHTHDRYNKRVSTLSESPTTYYRVIRLR